MEDFRNYKEKENIEEIQIFLKNSSVDLLKTIARQYRLPVSTKRKELIILDILQSVKERRPFLDQDQPLHSMTIPQLRNKARQLNIDFSNLHKKQELRLAIIQKMAQVRTTTTGGDASSASAPKYTLADLEEKKLPSLKDLAKSYKIKVSKLSKKQLITSILEAEMMGVPSTPSKGSPTNTLSKMRKNELIVLAEERGIPAKGRKKEELVRMLSTNDPSLSAAVTIVPNPMEWMQQPMTADAQQRMRKDRKVTVSVIRDLLHENNINVPKGATKRDDLLTLLFKETTSLPGTKSTVGEEDASPPRPQPHSVASTTRKTTKKKVVIQEPSDTEGEDIVSEDDIGTPDVVSSTTTKLVLAPEPTTTEVEDEDDEAEEDVVSLDDIQTPFEPIALETLLEEPSEKQLQEELYRCLQFYEHPH